MKFIVNDRTIKADGETIISYNLDYMAEFEFDPEWSDKIITARFVLTNGNYYDVILEDNKCQIPLFKKGLVALGVYTDEFTSTYVTLSVHSSIKDLGNNEVIPPSEDVYQQIIRMIEEGKIKGDKGDPGDDYIITESDYQAIADRVPQPDLTDYVKNTDYATNTSLGVAKGNASIGLPFNGGTIGTSTQSYESYKTRSDFFAITKGTLENVLNERMKEPQFELIEEITLTEDVTSITRTAEPDGTPYNFKAMAFEINTPKVENNDRLKLFYNTNSAVYTKYGAEITDGLSTSSAKSIGIVWRIENGLLISEWASNNNKTTESYIKGFGGLKFIDSLTSVLITSNITLPSGTTIKIYAVRG